jgi:glycine cleavage system H lipoate-binding protein
LILSLNDKFWLQPTDKIDVFGLGLTEEYLQKLGQMWSIVPRTGTKLVKDGIFANVESSRCLGPLRAPCGGVIIEWNEKVLDTPDLIRSDVAILTIGDVK